MTRGISTILGIGLIILWIVGLGSPTAPAWMVWLNGIAGVLAFFVAGAARPGSTRSTRASGPVGLGIGLFVLWIIGMSSGSPSWLNWWTFAFACAFTILGFSASTQPEALPRRTTPSETEQDRFRRTG